MAITFYGFLPRAHTTTYSNKNLWKQEIWYIVWIVSVHFTLFATFYVRWTFFSIVSLSRNNYAFTLTESRDGKWETYFYVFWLLIKTVKSDKQSTLSDPKKRVSIPLRICNKLLSKQIRGKRHTWRCPYLSFRIQ